MLVSNHYNVPKMNNTKFTGFRMPKTPYKGGLKVAKIINNNSKSKSIWHITRDFLTELIDTYTY